MTRPAWVLPNGHPDLCPGSHEPAFHCYPVTAPTSCPVCSTRVLSYPAPNTPGGGRLSAHYRVTDIQLTLDDIEARK